MVGISEWVFWLSSILVVYPYIIYPLLLALHNRLFGTRSVVDDSGVTDWPRVSLIVSAYNEEASIAEKLNNALSLDYPVELFDIVVVSDGSTDSTEDIIRQFSHSPQIKLIALKEQVGKSVGLNHAVPMCEGDIIVFSDANAIYDNQALRKLVAAFTDAEVGYAVGSALYHDSDEEAVNVSEGLYWKYELWIKQLESGFSSVVGGDGAIYAIRKRLFRELESIDISDFVNPLQIIAAGFRGVFIAAARSFEGGTDEFSDEFRRKRRIVNRAWGAVRRYFSLFSFRKHPRFLFMLISHKIIRWYSFAFVLLALFSAAVLASSHDTLRPLYAVLFLMIVGSLLLGLLGWMMDRNGRDMPRIVYLIYYFYLVGLAGMLGIVDDFRGRRIATWTHVR